MKKYLIFGLLILALAAFVIVPFFKNKNVVSDNATDDLPAMFSFKENLATKGDEVVALKIAINSSEIKLMEIFYNDSVVGTWKNPTATLNYSFKAGVFGVGTRSLVLHTTLKDGSTFYDERLVRVFN